METASAIPKLAAFDDDDLLAISARLQDAVLTVGDIALSQGQTALALLVRRFDWETAGSGGGGHYRRILSALRIAHVLAVRSRHIDRGARDGVLSLLSVSFRQAEAPAGIIDLIFAGGGQISIEVECLEATLEDLGPQWETSGRPDHGLGDGE